MATPPSSKPSSPPEPRSTRGRAGWTPLHRAAFNLNRTVVPVLVAFGADLEARNTDGSTPLHLGAEQFHLRGDPEIVESLLGAGADPSARDATGDTPLHRAAEHNQNPAVVRLLVAAGADPDARNGNRQTPLHFAALLEHDSPGVVEALLAAGADAGARDAAGATPADYAGDARILALLTAASRNRGSLPRPHAPSVGS